LLNLARLAKGSYAFSSLAQIVHFTHEDNLPAILEAGALLAPANAEPSVDVADADIKGRRQSIPVPCGPEGCVADYVPFYFCVRSPMLYRIKYEIEQRNLIYLVCDTADLEADDREFVFTDGNAATFNLTTFSDDPADLDELVDWELMKAEYWNNTDADPDRKRRRQAECLVYGSVPIKLLRGIGVFNSAARERTQSVLEQAGVETGVTVVRNWYF
jgi:hypothetical protein